MSNYLIRLQNLVNNEVMKHISLISQNILRIILIYLLSFIWIKYLIQSLWLSILLSVLVSLFIDIMIRIINKKKNNKQNLKIKEIEEAENIFLSLATNTDYISFFHKLAQKENINAEKKAKYIILPNQKNKIILYPFLSMNELKKDDIAKLIILLNKEKANKLVIVCGEIDKNALIFSKSIEKDIVLLDKFESYKQLYKYYNLFPEITLSYQKNKKLAWKELFAYSFNKTRTKGYIFSAFILFLSSLYIPMNFYYCFMASLLLVFALISHFNKPFNPKTNKLALN